MKIKSNLAMALLLAGLCLASYGQALNNPFIMDDQDFLLSDTMVRDMGNIPLYLYHGTSLTDAGTLGTDRLYYRPLAHIAPVIKYHFFRDRPLGYHAFNLAMLFIASYLVFLLVKLIQPNFWIAAIAGILFCVHPLNGLLVHYIAADVDTIPLVLLLSATICYLKYKADQRKIWYEFFSLLCFSLAMLFHELYITYPYFIFLIAYFIHKNSVKASLLETVPFFMIAACFLWARGALLGFHFNLLQNFAAFDMSFFEYTATLMKLMLWYLSTLFLLKDVVLIYALDVVRDNVLFNNLLLAGLITLVAFLVFRWKKKLTAFALLWLVFGFVPATLGALVQPKFGLIFEPHWMVVPSFGFFLLTALLLRDLSERMDKRLFIGLFSALVIFSVSICRYNGWLWADQERYARLWMREAPRLKLATFFLASSLAEKNKLEEAHEAYLAAIDNSFFDFQIYNNLGLIAFSMDNAALAEDYLRKAIAIHPRSAVTYNNLGVIFLRTGQTQQAKDMFLKALTLNAQLIEPRLNLGRIYIMDGRQEDAIKMFEGNLKIDAQNEETLFELIQAYLAQGNGRQALTYGQMLLENSKNASTLTSLGSLFAQQGYVDAAFPCYIKAQQLDNFYTEVYIEFGKLYGNLEMFPQAISVWKDGLLVAPDDERFKAYIAQALELMKGAEPGPVSP